MGLPILAVAASLAPPPKRFGPQESAKRDAACQITSAPRRPEGVPTALVFQQTRCQLQGRFAFPAEHARDLFLARFACDFREL